MAELAAGPLTSHDLGSWVRVVATIAPDPTTAAGHDRRYAAFRRLYEETRETVHGLAARGASQGR